MKKLLIKCSCSFNRSKSSMYEKTRPLWLERQGNGPEKTPSCQYKYEALFNCRSDKGLGYLCLRTIPGPRELWGPGPHPTFRWVTLISWGHQSVLLMIWDLFLNFFHNAGGQSQHPSWGTEGTGGEEQRSGSPGMVCFLSFLGNGFLGSVRKFELMENGRPLPLQIKFPWSAAYGFPGSILNSDVVLPSLDGPFPPTSLVSTLGGPPDIL